MVRMLVYFFITLFYALLTTGEIQNVPEKLLPKTIKDLKELSANFQPLLTPETNKNTSYKRKNLREVLRGYSDQEIQRMLDIASAK